MAGQTVATLGIAVEADVVGVQTGMQQAVMAVQSGSIGMAKAFGQAEAAAGAIGAKVGDAGRQIGQAMSVAERALAQSGLSFRGLEGAAERLRRQIDPLRKSTQDYEADLRRANAMLANSKISWDEYVQAIRIAKARQEEAIRPLQQTGVIAGSTRAGMQQLSMQLGDVTTQWALGTPAMQIWAAQSGQIIQSVQMMTGGTSKLAAFLGGPWGIAITGATMVLAPLVGKLFESEKAAKKSEQAQRSFSEVIGDAKAGWDELTEAAKAYTKQIEAQREETIAAMAREARMTQTRLDSAKATREVLRANLELAKQNLEDNGVSLAGQLPGSWAEVGRRLDAVNEKILKNNTAIAEMERNALAQAEKIGARIATLETDSTEQIREGARVRREEARSRIHDARDLADAYAEINRAEAAAIKATTDRERARRSELELTKVTMREVADAIGATITSGLRTAAQNRAAKGAANSYHLTGQAIDIPLTVNGRPLTKDGIRAALAPLGVDIKELLGPGDKDHNDHFHIAFALNRLTPDQVRSAAEDAARAGERIGDALERSIMGSAGEWLDKLKLDLKEYGESWSAIYRELADADVGAVMGEARSAGVDMVGQLRNAVEPAAQLREELGGAAAYLMSIGGDIGRIGRMADALQSGDWSQIGEAIGGRAGSLLTMIGSVSWQATDKNGQRFTQTFRSMLSDTFSESGVFGQTMASLLRGMGTGSLVGGIAFGGDKSAQMGSSIGGALGQAAGEKFLTTALGKMGNFAGPIGAIAGALLGGIVGSLFKKIPKASATIGAANGALAIGSVTGNSNSRKAASTQGANSVIDALNQIADAFGASIGGTSVSIGMRKNSYVVDPSGQGRTKGAGVLNFGKDSEAALKAAIADAISDGVFIGLSAGVERLLKNGDVEKQLQKALSFQGVFDDLAKAKDPAAAAAAEIGRWHDSMAKIFAEAGATATELADLEELTGIKRAAAAREAARAQLEEERPYREAAIRILELEGKASEALAASRALELAGMDEGLRPLNQRIWALQDEAEAAAKAEALAQQQRALEIQLMDVGQALAATRADELAALDPTLRHLQELVWLREDEAEAIEAARQIEKARADERAGLETQWLQLIGESTTLRAREREALDASNRALYDQIIAEQDRQAAAAEADRIAKDAAETARTIAEKRRALEIQLMGDADALAASRADELAQLDPTLRHLQELVWAREDEAAAIIASGEAMRAVMAVADQRRALTVELARLIDPVAAQVMERADALRALDPSLRDLQQLVWSVGDGIDAAAKAAQDLKDAADAAAALADQRRGLTIQLAEAVGDTAAAEAMRRADALRALDPSLRGLQQQVYDAIDAANLARAAEEELARQRAAQAEAEQARIAAIADARGVLVEAYNRESGALQGTIDRFRDFAQTIREFRDGLIGGVDTGVGHERALSQFRSTAWLAQLGSADALGRFSADATALLDAARDSATNGTDYRRTLAMVLAGANGAIGAAAGTASMAQTQLDALKAQVSELVDINEAVVSVAEALERYREASGAAIPVMVDTVSGGLETLVARIDTAATQAQTAQADARVAQDTAAVTLVRIERLLQRVTDNDRLRVGVDDTISVNANVTNTAPIPVDTTP